jgi:hypothetical protein
VLLVSLALFICFAAVRIAQLQSAEAEPGQTQHLKNPDAVPDGLTATDWADIRAVYEASAQQAYLKASNTDDGDVFGFSVAVSGDTVVVGAPYEDSNATGVNGVQTDNSATDSGAAYVFVRGGTTWTQQAYLKASNTGASDLFGNSVAVSGDTVVVGASHEDSNATGVNGDQTNNSATDSGAAYVFVRGGTTWTQQAYLKASNTGASDLFGYSVAVSGDTVVVGAYGEASNATGVNGDQTNNSASFSGAAYVFTETSPPPSRGATLSGRVFTPDGRGLRSVVVSIRDPQGVTRTVTTNSFGYYVIENVRTGESYTMRILSRRYKFAPRPITVSGDLAGVDFVGSE